MANDDKANIQLEDLTNKFRALEKADIQLRNDLKHNISKIHKGNEAITEIEHKKQKLIDENTQNGRILPEKEKELADLTAKKV
jgi:hypothetical protein